MDQGLEVVNLFGYLWRRMLELGRATVWSSWVDDRGWTWLLECQALAEIMEVAVSA
jgi:hypothetical protein